MVGFIGRETELRMLQRRYDSGKFECVVVYGRRRIGKTALINRFVQDKPAIFYTATENGAERNLKGLSASIARYRNGLNSVGSPVYEDYRDAFEDVFRMAERDRLILVIDEYPYLAKAEPMVSSLLQQLIDQHHGTGKLMLILSGSSMSFMERQVLGYQSPLYGRRTAQIKVMPFDYRESRGFVPDMGKEDAAVVYGITGGIPQYLIQFDDGVSLEENLRWNVLDPSAYLFEEPGKLLQEELRKPAEYNNIIQTIASGASSGVKIANGSHIEQTVLSHYLRNLSDLHIIVKETPYPEGSRRGIWRIEDLLFRFWYRYIPDNMSLIESGTCRYRRPAHHEGSAELHGRRVRGHMPPVAMGQYCNRPGAVPAHPYGPMVGRRSANQAAGGDRHRRGRQAVRPPSVLRMQMARQIDRYPRA